MPAPTATPSGEGEKCTCTATYTIQWGDTLGGIALRYHTTIKALQRCNGISNSRRIYAGKELCVPEKVATPQTSCSATYHIRPGDTLSAIALRYGTTIKVLRQCNHIQNPRRIYAGQWLRVPDKSRCERLYKIKWGDTLSGIALRYHTTVRRLQRCNDISNPHYIYADQWLRVPN